MKKLRISTMALSLLALPVTLVPAFSPAMAHDSHAQAPAGESTRPADLGIQIHDPYAFAALPNAPTAAAFMIVHNHGTEDDRLLSVSSDVAARTELHDHVMGADGVAQMVHVAEGFVLKGYDDELRLERGGAHVMFMGLKEPFTDGMTFPLTLHFEKAGDVVVEVSVDLARMTAAAAGGEHAGHGDHAGHGGGAEDAPAHAH